MMAGFGCDGGTPPVAITDWMAGETVVVVIEARNRRLLGNRLCFRLPREGLILIDGSGRRGFSAGFMQAPEQE